MLYQSASYLSYMISNIKHIIYDIYKNYDIRYDMFKNYDIIHKNYDIAYDIMYDGKFSLSCAIDIIPKTRISRMIS